MTPIETIQQVDMLLLAAKLPTYSDVLGNINFYREEEKKLQETLAPFKPLFEALINV